MDSGCLSASEWKFALNGMRKTTVQSTEIYPEATKNMHVYQ